MLLVGCLKNDILECLVNRKYNVTNVEKLFRSILLLYIDRKKSSTGTGNRRIILHTELEFLKITDQLITFSENVINWSVIFRNLSQTKEFRNRICINTPLDNIDTTINWRNQWAYLQETPLSNIEKQLHWQIIHNAMFTEYKLSLIGKSNGKCHFCKFDMYADLGIPLHTPV